MLMCSYISSGARLLLDIEQNAALGLSVRKLRTAYAGACMRVRRSSDNTEQDIGFVNDLLDTASLLTFAGAGNAFVTVWYDQSGNGQNFNQTTAGEQPAIVLSGVLVTRAGLPSIRLLNSRLRSLNNTSFNTAPDFSAFMVWEKSAAATEILFAANNAATAAGSNWELNMQLTGNTLRTIKYSGAVGVASDTTTPSVNQYYQSDHYWNAANVKQGISNAALTTSNPLAGINTNALFAAIGGSAATTSLRWQGYITEVVRYNTNKEASRAVINQNQRLYFGTL